MRPGEEERQKRVEVVNSNINDVSGARVALAPAPDITRAADCIAARRYNACNRQRRKRRYALDTPTVPLPLS